MSLITSCSARVPTAPSVVRTNDRCRVSRGAWSSPASPESDEPSRPIVLTALAAGLGLAVSLGRPDVALASGPGPQYSGVDPNESSLIQSLKKKSDENKSTYDEQRLDNYYKRDFRINKIIGAEVLAEPCDPRDPEFGYKCGSKLPRLPQDRVDPFDPRSEKNAPRKGSVFGLNDLNIELEDDFQGNNVLDGAEGGDPAVAEEGVGLDTDVDAIVDKAVDGVIAGVREEDAGGIGVDEYLRGATD